LNIEDLRYPTEKVFQKMKKININFGPKLETDNQLQEAIETNLPSDLVERINNYREISSVKKLIKIDDIQEKLSFNDISTIEKILGEQGFSTKKIYEFLNITKETFKRMSVRGSEKTLIPEINIKKPLFKKRNQKIKKIKKIEEMKEIEEIEEIDMKDGIKKILDNQKILLDLLLEKNKETIEKEKKERKEQEIEELFEEFPNVNSPHSVRFNDWILAELQRIARKKSWSTQSALNKACLFFIHHYQEDCEDEDEDEDKDQK
jgi:hypothetical protein